MFNSFFGEMPKTKFTPLYRPRIVVECPNMDEMIPRLKKVIGATWAEDINEAFVLGKEEKLFKGTALWQGLEYLQFFITIENVSRVFTHQLVRMRIGATYSQQCSGDSDWRHHDVLYPPSLSAEKFEEYCRRALQNKMDYARMIDEGYSVQEARYMMQQNYSTFIMMNINMAALAPFIKKRMCPQTQCWEMITVVREIRRQILNLRPIFTPMLEDECRKGACFWARSIQANDPEAHTNLYKEDGTHMLKGAMTGMYQQVKSVYPKTHQEMIHKEGYGDHYYIGATRTDPWD